jgi:hypothetical protein
MRISRTEERRHTTSTIRILVLNSIQYMNSIHFAFSEDIIDKIIESDQIDEYNKEEEVYLAKGSNE